MHVYLIPAKEVAAGDLILTKGSPAQRKIVLKTTTRLSYGRPQVGLYTSESDAWYLPVEEEVLVIRRGTQPDQTSEELNAELTRLTKAFLVYLEIDRESDSSTDVLMAMAGTAHQLAERLQDAYCSGEHPCFPSGNRESIF